MSWFKLFGSRTQDDRRLIKARIERLERSANPAISEVQQLLTLNIQRLERKITEYPYYSDKFNSQVEVCNTLLRRLESRSFDQSEFQTLISKLNAVNRGSHNPEFRAENISKLSTLVKNIAVREQWSPPQPEAPVIPADELAIEEESVIPAGMLPIEKNSVIPANGSAIEEGPEENPIISEGDPIISEENPSEGNALRR